MSDTTLKPGEQVRHKKTGEIGWYVGIAYHVIDGFDRAPAEWRVGEKYPRHCDRDELEPVGDRRAAPVPVQSDADAANRFMAVVLAGMHKAFTDLSPCDAIRAVERLDIEEPLAAEFAAVRAEERERCMRIFEKHNGIPVTSRCAAAIRSGKGGVMIEPGPPA